MLCGLDMQRLDIHTVQLKRNLTHTDRAHATYWLKARSFINPYWHVREDKPAKINC